MSDQQLVFEDVTDQWEIDDAFIDRGWRIFVSNDVARMCALNGVTQAVGIVRKHQIVGNCSEVIATRKPSKPPEPKYVPFANAKEARSFVGCQPYVRPINGDWAGIQMAYVWDWDELCERYMWSNTPDDPSSWKPFGKLVTE